MAFRLHLIICLIGINLFISAQQTVFKTYYSIDSSDNNPIPFAIETNGAYIYPSFYDGIGNPDGLGLRKIDKSGNTLNFSLLKGNDSFSPFLTAMNLIEPNKILIVGRNYWQKVNQMKALIMLIDTNLNILAEYNHIHKGYTNEIYDEIFYDYDGNLCTLLKEYTYSINPDSMYFSIRKINTNDFTTSQIMELKGYDPLQLIKTLDGGYLLYTFSPKYEKQYYTDPIMLKFDRNWNLRWERNLGDYGSDEMGGYGITRMVELNNQYFCWVKTTTLPYLGYMYRINNDGVILNQWRNKDSSLFQTLISKSNKIIAFGDKYTWNAPVDITTSVHIFDSNYNISKQNHIGFREFYDTCSSPRDSTLYHMDATRTSDGGFLIFNSGSSYGAKGKVVPFGSNFDILFKTDSCGYTAGDTCKLVPRIDSVVYNKVYLSLDELNYKVCGRRWSVDGKVFTTEKLIYSFSDTGTYTIGIWGFAGSTTDSTTIQVRISQLDSCSSRKTDTCRMKGFVSQQVCETLKFAIDKSFSQYCTRYWRIENKVFYEDTISYNFPSKNTYSVYLIGKRGITIDTSKLIVKVDCMSSVLSSDIPQYNIYPNPARDYVLLSFPSSNLTLREPTIILYNLLGQAIPLQIQKEGIDKLRIDISALPMGIYLLKLINRDGEEIHRDKIEVRK